MSKALCQTRDFWTSDLSQRLAHWIGDTTHKQGGKVRGSLSLPFCET